MKTGPGAALTNKRGQGQRPRHNINLKQYATNLEQART